MVGYVVKSIEIIGDRKDKKLTGDRDITHRSVQDKNTQNWAKPLRGVHLRLINWNPFTVGVSKVLSGTENTSLHLNWQNDGW